jgi:hypothetical protein
VSDGLPILLEAKLRREFELAHSNYEQRIKLLRQTLEGFASNGTNCRMCQMMNEIATESLARDDRLAR